MSRTPRSLSVRRSPDLDADLEVLQRGGLSASDAVRHAVHLIAQAHRAANQLSRGGRRPAALSIRTIDLIRPYDAEDACHTGGAPVAQDGGGER
ncbi:hypothetical protein [Streptomyces phaeochromogenes]